MNHVLSKILIGGVLGLTVLGIGASTSKADPWHRHGYYHRPYVRPYVRPYAYGGYYGGYYPSYAYAYPSYAYAYPSYGYGYGYGPGIGVGVYASPRYRGGFYHRGYRRW